MSAKDILAWATATYPGVNPALLKRCVDGGGLTLVSESSNGGLMTNDITGIKQGKLAVTRGPHEKVPVKMRGLLVSARDAGYKPKVSDVVVAIEDGLLSEGVVLEVSGKGYTVGLVDDEDEITVEVDDLLIVLDPKCGSKAKAMPKIPKA